MIISLAVFGLYWYDGYDAARSQGENTTYFGYVRKQLSAIRAGLGELPSAVKDARRGRDNIVKGSMNKLQEALMLYNLNTGVYPGGIAELLSDYISDNNSLIKEPSFYYYSAGSGYEMGVTLPVSGEKYVIRQ